jgi:hypothetical protein
MLHPRTILDNVPTAMMHLKVGQIIALTILALQIVSPATREIHLRTIIVASALSVIPPMDGQVENLTTVVKRIASIAIRMMLQPIITQVNARIAIILTMVGRMQRSTTQDSPIADPVTLVMRQRTITPGNAQLATTPVAGLEHRLTIAV